MSNRWRHFRLDEFRCPYSNQNYIDHRFVDVLDVFREELGVALVVLSGYRSPEHPLEVGKKKPGWHAKGKAVDLLIPDGVAMRRAVELALRSGIPGIGVNNNAIHLDIRDTTPVMWGY